MIIRVVPDFMSFGDDPPDDAGIPLRIYSHEEKRRFNVCCF